MHKQFGSQLRFWGQFLYTFYGFPFGGSLVSISFLNFWSFWQLYTLIWLWSPVRLLFPFELYFLGAMWTGVCLQEKKSQLNAIITAMVWIRVSEFIYWRLNFQYVTLFRGIEVIKLKRSLRVAPNLIWLLFLPKGDIWTQTHTYIGRAIQRWRRVGDDVFVSQEMPEITKTTRS